MKSMLALALFAGLVAAQSDGIPRCAQPCVNEYTTGGKIAGCRQFDVKCICSNADFLSGIACCLENACDQAGKDTAVSYAKGICSSQGVEVPDQVVCNKASESSASSASSSASNTPSPASQSSASGTPANSAPGTPTSSGAGTQTSTAASETETPGAASGLGAMGGAIGAVVAMLMAL